MPVKTFFESLVGKGAKLQSLLFKQYSQAGLGESQNPPFRLNATLQLGERDWNLHYKGDELVTKHLVANGIIVGVRPSQGTMRFEMVADEGKLPLLQAAHEYLQALPKARARRK